MYIHVYIYCFKAMIKLVSLDRNTPGNYFINLDTIFRKQIYVIQ